MFTPPGWHVGTPTWSMKACSALSSIPAAPSDLAKLKAGETAIGVPKTVLQVPSVEMVEVIEYAVKTS